jgi:hypothetical protein
MVDPVPVGSVFVWSCELWILCLVYLSIAMATNANALATSGKFNTLDHVASILLFAASTVNIIVHVVTMSVMRGYMTASIDSFPSAISSSWIKKQRVHVQMSNIVCSLCFIVCWTYVFLYVDTCLMSALSSSKADESTGTHAQSSSFLQQAMCQRALFQGVPAFFTVGPALYASVTSALHVIVFFVSLALSFTTSSYLVKEQDSMGRVAPVFFSKQCLYAAGVLFAFSHPSVKMRVLSPVLCDKDKADMDWIASAFLPLIITGSLLCTVEDLVASWLAPRVDAYDNKEEYNKEEYNKEEYSNVVPKNTIVQYVDVMLGIRLAWVILCLSSLVVVACIPPQHRGAVGYVAGLGLLLILVVWGIVSTVLLGLQRNRLMMADFNAHSLQTPQEQTPQGVPLLPSKKKDDSSYVLHKKMHSAYPYQLLDQRDPVIPSTSRFFKAAEDERNYERNYEKGKWEYTAHKRHCSGNNSNNIHTAGGDNLFANKDVRLSLRSRPYASSHASSTGVSATSHSSTLNPQEVGSDPNWWE